MFYSSNYVDYTTLKHAVLVARLGCSRNMWQLRSGGRIEIMLGAAKYSSALESCRRNRICHNQESKKDA